MPLNMLATVVRDSLPNYLQSVPLPRDLSEVKNLSKTDVLHLLVLTGSIAGVVHYLNNFVSKRVNHMIDLKSGKVVHSMKTSELKGSGKNKWYCRCWKSKTFPYCDGAHKKHNEVTGDNVGPLGVKDE